MRIVPLFLCLFIAQLVYAQLEVTTGIPPTSLVWKDLIGPNSGLKIINIRYRGAPFSIGKFRSEAEHIDITNGIILCTGYAKDAAGPNNAAGQGQHLYQPGDRQLVRLANNVTMDACVLEFDFVPRYNRIEFQFVFASEEYPEFINKGLNDVFGFFLNEKGKKVITNLAVVPGTNEPITVDNINHIKNAEYFIKNERWNLESGKIVEGNHEVNEYAYNFQYDGLTHWLTAEADVIPNVAYHLKIAIADAGDGVYDSAVFLKSNSFHAEEKKEEQTLATDLKTLLENEEIKSRGDSVVLELHLNFDTDKDAVSNADDLVELIKVSDLLVANQQLQVKIEGHTDNDGSEEYNLDLSKRRANWVMNWLINHAIEASRLSANGFGATSPIATNSTEEGKAKNRRVEFVFY